MKASGLGSDETPPNYRPMRRRQLLKLAGGGITSLPWLDQLVIAATRLRHNKPKSLPLASACCRHGLSQRSRQPGSTAASRSDRKHTTLEQRNAFRATGISHLHGTKHRLNSGKSLLESSADGHQNGHQIVVMG